MKEIRLNGVVLRPTSRGWQVGEAAMRTREGVRVEHLVRIKHYSLDDVQRAVANFTGRALSAAEMDERADVLAAIQDAVKGVWASVARIMEGWAKKKTPTRKRKKDGPRIYVRVDEEEQRLIRGAAQAQGKTPAEFVRDAALSAAHRLLIPQPVRRIG